MAFETSADNRQFGRRTSQILAHAELPGHIILPCMIENISDGGALLRFTAGAAPTQSFRLVIEGTEFRLLCEIRHGRFRQVGVRFVKLADGIALNRYLQLREELPAEAPLRAKPLDKPRSARSSVRALRETVMARQREQDAMSATLSALAAVAAMRRQASTNSKA